MELEVDSKHAKRHILDLNLHKEIDKKIYRIW